jgi:hypothetical protein
MGQPLGMPLVKIQRKNLALDHLGRRSHAPRSILGSHLPSVYLKNSKHRYTNAISH